ncbi:hypothetical protein EU528_00460 [Candidatus Thorarchaeota archaeon]|nr:MAG: hypothetical protein EU528_00460 [Candidatus Thorarchaeota archaeon]
MSLLGKYRREEADKDDEASDGETTTVERKPQEPTKTTTSEILSAVPNKERKSPIVSFSIPTDLRTCLQAIRKTKAINLSLWVEHQLREAIAKEFPQIADEYLE